MLETVIGLATVCFFRHPCSYPREEVILQTHKGTQQPGQEIGVSRSLGSCLDVSLGGDVTGR